MTSPIYLDDRPGAPPPPEGAPSEATGDASPDRVRRLEEEVFTLRDTMSRFAELVLGELKQMRQPGQAPAASAGAVPMPELPIAATEPENTRRPWLLVELLRDITTTFRMYLDPRYRVRRSTQILIPVILGLFVLNYLFFSAFLIPVLGTILMKAGDIILAVLLYMVLNREMIRYREVLRQYSLWEASRHGGGTRVVHGGEEPHTQLDMEG